jgi:cytochrome c oxidase cbb3-type subunit 1
MVQHEDKSAQMFIYLSIVFFLVTITIGLIMAFKFVWPEFLGGIAALSFGRIRPMHTNGVLFGWLLAADMGLAYYIVPRLCGVKLFSEKIGILTFFLWIIIILSAVVTLGIGITQSKEYLELTWWLDILVAIVWVLFSFNLFATIAKRKYEQMYVSLWYIMGTLFWTTLLWVVGNLPVYRGVNDANVAWWFGHNAVGLIFTPFGVALAYFFIPKAAEKPLYSHKLSLIGFWTIAFIYVWTGAHHLIFGPVPVWLQTISILFSVGLIIPVWTVIANFYNTLKGKWTQHFILKFLMAGTVFYVLTCFQGPSQALRHLNQITSKTDWVPGHAHMAVFGAFSFFAISGIYYALPRILKTKLYSNVLGEWHFWLSFIGFFGFAISLWTGGFTQGLQLSNPMIPFIDAVRYMKPYYIVRLFSSVLIVLGQIFFAYNIFRTAIHAPQQQPQLKPAEAS